MVYPLPLADFGLFCRGSPKLSRRRWSTLLKKRLRHILIVALNFLHGGISHKDLHLLGRRPNQSQLVVHRRLWALLSTCDSPELHSVVPGRSGPEFIARLLELEHFAKSVDLFHPEGYGGGPADLSGKACQEPKDMSAVGRVSTSGLGLPAQPYSNLDSSRLKIVGDGTWKLADFLEDELWLPYVEPKILHHHLPLSLAAGPNLKKEDPEENLRLALLWSSHGLLALFRQPPHKNAFTRIFNARKNETTDRQIGDRRFANFAERHLAGPSKHLPSGYLLTGIHVPAGCTILGSITDRKDFYHQASVTPERAQQNCLPFRYDAQVFAGTAAYKNLLDREKLAPRGRENTGDQLGCFRPKPLLTDDRVYPAFSSLLQGDHLGVEFALAAHSSLLEEAGLLGPEVQLLGNHPFPSGRDIQGLVIDDFFALSVFPCGADPRASSSQKSFDAAVRQYEREGVLGSKEKDIEVSRHFKVIGAEIDGSEKAVSRGVISVGAPAQKRIAMTTLSLRAAALPIITKGFAAQLAGNWTSIFLYRRCLTCLLSKIYSYSSNPAAKDDEVFEMTRAAAQELVLSSIFSFLASSDVSGDFCEKVFATDASINKGAVVARAVKPEVAKALWLSGDKRGAYTMLDPPFKEILRTCDVEVGDDSAEDMPSGDRPSSGLDFSFDFVEICGGAASVSKWLADWGYSVMPPIDITYSRHYDLRNIRLVEWLAYMFSKRRIKAAMIEPVCTSFSPAAHPAVRSYKQPKGFVRDDPKTLLGNIIAFRCLFLAWVASLFECPIVLEQPRLSKMAWLSIWRMLLGRGFAEAICASCQFGSIHRKEFRLLCYAVCTGELEVRCPGGHRHVRIEGQYTKPSAQYVPELAKHFARVFATALRRQANKEADFPDVRGVESVAANDLLVTGSWEVEFQWHWQHASHINLLESHSYLALLRKLATDGGGCRFVCLLDSRVAKCAHAKGRSSSRALQPSLQKSAAVQVAYGLYPSLGFAPTRLNVADDPTRDTPVRITDAISLCDALSPERVKKLHSTGLSRPAAGWVRLSILLTIATAAEAQDSFRGGSFGFGTPFWISFASWILAGPVLLVIFGFCCCAIRVIGFWKPVCRFGIIFGLSLLTVGNHSPKINWTVSHELQPLPLALLIPCVVAMPMQPFSADERERASRRAGVQLHKDRVLRPQTRSRRETLLHEFEAWLTEHESITLSQLLDGPTVNAEAVSDILATYGQALFYAGKPYGRYSETINAVAGRRPHIKRSLVSAWDVAFAWVTDEPHIHHPAMPLSIVLAFGGLALLWGWPVEASIFLMTWTGILRIGEVFQALRSDLVLPCDAAPGVRGAILQIRQPKTRGSAARHQAARIDPEDIVALLTAVFRKKPKHERLWVLSPSTLRKRFATLQRALGLPLRPFGKQVPYDLASLRAGGATFLLQRFEDSELVRRRGRWVSSRVCEIYLQEVSVATFAEAMPTVAYSRVNRLAGAFPTILTKALFLLETQIPTGAWPRMF